MKQHRFAYIIMFALLLVSNWAILLWLQGGIGTAWANMLGAPQAVVTIPPTFSYQGILRDAQGDLITGNVTVTLKLYDAVTAGTILHNEVFPGVNVREGAFSLVVGNNTALSPALFTSGIVYLGLQIGSDPELLPRQRLHAVPWSIYASNANTATTANNLVQGGGVPSQLNFNTNGGSIIDSSTGMTLTGGGNGQVNIGGDLIVNGNWSASAILDTGDARGLPTVRSSYDVSLKRYVIEAKDGGSLPNGVLIDSAILLDYCQDIDGCQFTLGMRDYVPNNGSGEMATVGPHRMTIGSLVDGKRYWDHRDPTGTVNTGSDGDSVEQHILQVADCYFSDYNHLEGNAQNDSEISFYLLNWYGTYNESTMTCVLIVED